MNASTLTWRERAISYYRSLSDRDRSALLMLVLFMLLLVGYYGLYAPARDYHQHAREAYQLEHELNQWLQAQATAVRAMPIKAPVNAPENGSSLTLVNNSARQFQLNIKRVQPESNGDLRLWMEDVSFDNTLKWLHYLQSTGMRIRELNLDQSNPGKVNLRATFTT